MRAFKVRGIELAAVDVVPGVTRMLDIGTLVEGLILQDLVGMKILNVRYSGVISPEALAAHSWAGGLFIGPTTLDVADVFPNTAVDNVTWWTWRKRLSNSLEGQPVGTFRDVQMRGSTRGTRRIDSRFGETLWWAEETLGATVNTAWTFEVTLTS